MGKRSLWAIHALFFASGASALVYQVAWARDLSLVFGASFEAISIVLAAFMGGLAGGGFVFGRRGGARFGSPLRLYGILEIGVAFFALALPSLIDGVQRVYLSIALDAAGAGASLNAARVALSFGVLLLPTFCMGGTLPVLVRLLVHRYGELGLRLSRLYAINTLGAVVGTLAAGFVLLPALGVWRSELLAALTNALIGVTALVADRALGTRGSGEPAPRDAASPTDPAATPSATPAWPFRLAFFGTFVAGMGSLALEVAWSRAIAISTGANTYSFAVMLATFLVGIAIGSDLYGSARPRRAPESVQLGGVLAAIGISSAIVSLLIPNLPKLALFVNAKLLGGPGIRAGTTFVLSFAVMLLPCILMGIAFPLAGKARARLDLRFAESVGDLVALNTFGAILGSLLAGFVLIPGLGLWRTMLLASAAYVGWGLLVLCAAWGAARPRQRGLAAVAGAAALPLVLAAALSTPQLGSRTLGALPNNDQTLYLDAEGRLDFGLALERTRVLYAREGRGSTAVVIENGGVRSLLINGKVVATDSLYDMQHEYLLGHLPTLLHPHPKTAAVIGLGAGLTLGGVVAEESIERVVVVEIEPVVRGAALLFGDLNGEALSDPRVELAWQDGRNYMQTTRERFDVITADPIHPWAQGAAYLYTTEYYAMLAERLRPGGIVCQWLPLYELSREDLASVVASFTRNFEYANVWQATGDLLLIGSNAPIGVDLDRLAERVGRPRVARQLARAGLNDALTLLAEFVMDRPGMERFAEGATLNTDDNLYLEFSSPLSIGIDPKRHLPLIDSFRENAIAVVRDPGSRFASREELRAVLEGLQAAKAHVVRAMPLRQERLAAPTLEGVRELISVYRQALALGPGYRHATFLLASCQAILGELYRARGEAEEGMRHFRRALALDPGNAEANLYVGVDWAARERYPRALMHFERSIRRKPRSADAQAAAAQTLMHLGRFAPALERLDIAAAIRPDLAEIHRLRCRCLQRLGEPLAAVAACREARERDPTDSRIAIDLADALGGAGRHGDGIEVLRASLAVAGDGRSLRLRLAWLLATSPEASDRDGAEALRLVAPEVQRSRDPRVFDVFAAALAEAGRFAEATSAAARGAKLAAVAGDADYARLLGQRSRSYRAERPLRDTAPPAIF